MTRRVGGSAVVTALVAMMLAVPADGRAQELADFDYANLSFRGFGFEWGYIFPDRVQPTPTYGARFDLGYLGPGVRLVPSFTYWSSPFEAAEIIQLEERVASLVSRETGAPPPVVDLGTIEWTDYSLGLDAHVVWAVPFDVLTFAGFGFTAHVLDGTGTAIEGTFIEDLLDTVTAGFNLHLGLEYPLTDTFRVMGQGRYEVMEDLQFFHVRLGWQFLFGPLASGEARDR